MAEKEIGRVTHYFGHISVAAIDLTDALRVGDTIHIRGHVTDLTQPVESLQIDHQPLNEAGAGQDVAVKVQGHVREHDRVYKVT